VLKASKRCTVAGASGICERLSTRLGFAMSSPVVVSFSPRLAEARNGNQGASGIETE
jgi:hypothetical protein